MPIITFQGKAYEYSGEESLLDCINRQEGSLPFGCRAGICQACILKATKGAPPSTAQQGIKSALKEKGYFLACLCKPESDLEITLPDRRDELTPATIVNMEHLTPTILRLTTSYPDGFRYRAGQFVNFIRPEDGVARSYSLASTPDDGQLEFHIRLLRHGEMSCWITDTLKQGSEILLSEPMGDCYYRQEYNTQSLLLAGTGTGLAPLYGILRDALANKHCPKIHLVHGALKSSDLYLDQELQSMATMHDNIIYTPCLLTGSMPQGAVNGPVDRYLATLSSDSDRAAFLCGDSDSVEAMRRACITLGMSEPAIHSDSFGTGADNQATT